ncbi:hypothetical protein ACFQX7_38450 [Luedemannella flava]
MSGLVRVRGNASQSAAASAHGGTIVVDGDASLRAAISLKGATVAIAGDVGAYCGFLAQAGTVLIGGDAGPHLGDSLYEAVIYVAGRVRGLGTDARIEELTETDVKTVTDLVDRYGFDHVDPRNVTGWPPPASCTTSTPTPTTRTERGRMSERQRANHQLRRQSAAEATA